MDLEYRSFPRASNPGWTKNVLEGTSMARQNIQRQETLIGQINPQNCVRLKLWSREVQGYFHPKNLTMTIFKTPLAETQFTVAFGSNANI